MAIMLISALETSQVQVSARLYYMLTPEKRKKGGVLSLSLIPANNNTEHKIIVTFRKSNI